MDELLEQFFLEGRELVEQAMADFAVLAERPNERAALDSAFRAIHTLKGSVAIFALDPAEKVLHAAEDILEVARRNEDSLSSAALADLIASLDATDRWIDDLEKSGALPPDAAAVADALVARLAIERGDAAGQSAPLIEVEESNAAAWSVALLADLDASGKTLSAPTTLFRYTPDADCFFRGEDPLALAAAVPELEALYIRPAAGAWPEPDLLEPFACTSILIGASAASAEMVRTAFRLAPDQVEIIAAPTKHAAEDAGSFERENRRIDILRVDAARVDALADGLGELMVAVNAVSKLSDAAGAGDRELAASIRAVQARLEQVTARLHRDVSSVRAVPIDSALRRLPRLAREMADGLGKNVLFTVEGAEIEVDKQIADALFEPLLHLLRNAIDHGAEAPAERAAAGKPSQSRISLSFRRDGDAVLVRLTDDGRGIDPAVLRKLAIERELINADDAAAMSDSAALRLIFAAGFSTAREVTAISGRGVGMDAVQAAVERHRGTVDIESEVGAGTTFALRLPVSALMTRLLVVEAGQERYGVALDQVIETVRTDERDLQPVASGRACVLRGRTVPVMSLGVLLGAQEDEDPVARLLVTQAGGERVALRVTGFAERLNAFVRPSSGLLAAVPGVTGSTLMGDGSVLLVLDLPELLA